MNGRPLLSHETGTKMSGECETYTPSYQTENQESEESPSKPNAGPLPDPEDLVYTETSPETVRHPVGPNLGGLYDSGIAERPHGQPF